MYKSNLVLLFYVILFSCRSGSESTHEKKMNGINGEAVYILNDDGSIWNIYKEEYDSTGNAILVRRDTIELGHEFKSTLNVPHLNSRIKITSPTNQVIVSDENKGIIVKAYEFLPNKLGVYDFVGQIEYDSLVIPFEFKFIVIAKKE